MRAAQLPPARSTNSVNVPRAGCNLKTSLIPSSFRARIAISRCRNWSRAISRSIPRSGLALNVLASVSAWRLIPTSYCQTKMYLYPTGQWHRGAGTARTPNGRGVRYARLTSISKCHSTNRYLIWNLIISSWFSTARDEDAFS